MASCVIFLLMFRALFAGISFVNRKSIIQDNGQHNRQIGNEELKTEDYKK